MHHPHRLGACLYVPATHPQLGDIAAGRRLTDVRSLIYCTEDAVAEHELPTALAALRHAHPGVPITQAATIAEHPAVLDALARAALSGPLDPRA